MSENESSPSQGNSSGGPLQIILIVIIILLLALIGYLLTNKPEPEIEVQEKIVKVEVPVEVEKKSEFSAVEKSLIEKLRAYQGQHILALSIDTSKSAPFQLGDLPEADVPEIIIAPQSETFFALGVAEINETNRKAIDEFVEAHSENLLDDDKTIRIAGHTDDIPIATPQFPNNWVLSAYRSLSVVNYLIDHHNINFDKIQLEFYGPAKPQAENVSAENRSKNRRVELTLMQRNFD
ncbi:MAG: OmpA family protein [Verrucomicrobiota bacterium]